ncbi:stress-response A/B barrel domain-containing protein UP3-like [Hibiscus syriacus]|uniref:stress-response A/B barrel domain-containing protein UP3-like n=1 Tax=Hibiscus syriacus TaxID=106335 RepID=UPI0019249698|nr:stress-response A/B barrel domain-containing protein UP3-like [Hibiscus syriacus]
MVNVRRDICRPLAANSTASKWQMAMAMAMAMLALSFPSLKHLKRPVTSSTKTVPIVEHAVLFKVKGDTDQGKVNLMLNNLNGLVSLDPVVHLTAGPVLRTKSPISNFTHMLHSRYKSKEDLNAYAVHPDHQRVVKENVVPICDDIMAVDWVADNDPTPLSPPSGSAIKVTFLKLKENVPNELQGEILGEIKGIKEGISGVQQLTCGENFSARAKGFSLASVAVFTGVEEIEAAVGKEEYVNLQKQKVKDNLDGVIVVDYVVRTSSP